MDNPFSKGESMRTRLKMFMWGATGTGKTSIALQFPKVAIIDFEAGSDHYLKKWNPEILRASTWQECNTALNYLLTEKHPYKTLVIDPVTVMYKMVQRKWSDIFLKRKPKSKGHHGEWYDLQPGDWRTIGAEFEHFWRRVIDLDMNVVAIARAKPEYATGSGDFMRRIGDTFDAHRDLPHWMDTVVQLYHDGDKRFMAECSKDRSGHIPIMQPFHLGKTPEDAFGKFSDLLDQDELDRESKPNPAAILDPVEGVELKARARDEFIAERKDELFKQVWQFSKNWESAEAWESFKVGVLKTDRKLQKKDYTIKMLESLLAAAHEQLSHSHPPDDDQIGRIVHAGDEGERVIKALFGDKDLNALSEADCRMVLKVLEKNGNGKGQPVISQEGPEPEPEASAEEHALQEEIEEGVWANLPKEIDGKTVTWAPCGGGNSLGCGAPVRWAQKNGRNISVGPDGEAHLKICPKADEIRKATKAKKKEKIKAS